ncbi:MAG: OmpH family outer membrane protein [Proteobacteria bacterium]|nr:OmpH family outer membrane protein [Pseudomonadota bacterium]
MAQDTSGIAVIDIQIVMRDSTAAVGLRQSIEERRTAYQKEIGDLEEALRDREKSLTQQRNVLSPDLFGEKERSFQEEVAELGRLVEARKRQINQAMGGAMQQIQGQLTKVIEEVVAERHLTLVLPRSQVVFSAEPLEITDIVLERLNKRLPSVPITLPEE